jgi:hypothetical protein
LPRGASLAAPLCLRVRRSARLARRIEAHGVPLAGRRPTPTRSARTSGRLTAISPQPARRRGSRNGGSGARPPSEPALRRIQRRWAGSGVWQLGLVAERDDVLG